MRHPRKIVPFSFLLISSLAGGGLACSGLFPGSGSEEPAEAEADKGGPLVELTAAQVASAGLTSAPVEARGASATLRLPGTLATDPRRSFRVSPVVEGVVEEVGAVAHDSVRKGQVLARLRSSALGEEQVAWLEARANLRLATADRDRSATLRKDGVVSESQLLRVETDFQRAQVALAQADRKLSLAGMSSQRIEALEATDRRLGEMTLTSPADGVVLSSSVSRGQALAAGEVAFEVADLSTLWVTVHVPVVSLAEVRPGAKAVVRVGGGGTAGWDGEVGSLGAAVDATDQTVEARVVVANEAGFLRPGMYAEVEVVGAPVQALMVSSGAPFTVGNQAYVFQKVGDTQFRPVAVTAASPLGEWTPVSGPGIEAGVEVVVTGVAELKSQWLYEGE
ncbi:MAG: efflux RND transporter periplasmic adaptor subunit [Pseudomonadota bacterium]|nr:efflux RND transporter periplasmic adaptor subunit [Pseudomonadota bacterium]